MSILVQFLSAPASSIFAKLTLNVRLILKLKENDFTWTHSYLFNWCSVVWQYMPMQAEWKSTEPIDLHLTSYSPP